MQTGAGLQKLAKIYVDTLLRGFAPEWQVDTDILYGPAYKGLPLASVVVAELYRQTGQDLGFASHRKEAKGHGADKGRDFGMKVTWKRSILVDDVITAGTAARNSVEDIHADNGTVNGMVVLLDRQEVAPPESWDATIPPAPGEPRVSAIMQLETAEWIRVVSALTFAHIRQAIEEGLIGNGDIGAAMDKYNRRYGVNP
jgi:orotate phosphoribosyltransferase